MSGTRMLGPRWSAWGRDVGLGFSYREAGPGSLRGDMAPAVNPDNDGLVEWRCVLWRGTDRTDVIAAVWGMTFWHCAEDVEALADELRAAA